MRISEAISKSRKQKMIGWLLIITSSIFLLMSFILCIYRITKDDTPIFHLVSQFLNNTALVIYQNTYYFLKPLWDYSPTFYYPNVFVEGNLKLLAVFGAFTLGIIMRDSGNHLSNRINLAKRKAEEKLWERSLTGDISSNNVLAIEITMESKDSWYTRPEGIIMLSVIAGYIVNILSNISGL